MIFVGCSPCQHFSNIKTDKTKSEKTRLLLADFQVLVEYFNPGYIFIENVTGLNGDKEGPLDDFKNLLSKKGYVYDDQVLNAKYFGVPQNRRRYVLLATRVKKQIKLPRPDIKNLVVVKDAISDQNTFPPIEAGTYDNSNFIHSSAILSELNLKRIRATPKNGGDRRVWKNNPELQLECYKNHEGHYDVYGRMYWDKPSPAITTRFRSLSNGRYGHPEQNRAISLREGATLQSFPLDYNFISHSQSKIAQMIGNAVPPLLAQKIAESIIN